MENGTVILSTKEYNELRDFKDKIERGFTLKVEWHPRSNRGIVRQYITYNATIKEINDSQTGMLNHYRGLLTYFEKNISELEQAVQLKPTIEDIKKMSYWEFRKWKKS